MVNIDPTLLSEITSTIESNEGFEAKVYLDTTGNITIGYGRSLSTNPLTLDEWNVILPVGITKDQATVLSSNSIQETLTWLTRYTWWNALSDNRKVALADMAYANGQHNFIEFRHMLADLDNGNYQGAANSMIASTWYLQEPNRVHRDADLMLNG